jgi:sugar phosphate isomerase/epimerase
VHLKDRRRGGPTVPFGRGDVDFSAVVGELAACGFSGPFVLEAARGETGDEVAHVTALARQARELLGVLG